MRRSCKSIDAVLLPPLLFFLSLLLHDTINVSDTEMEAITIEQITEAELAKELREQYIKHPPEGMTSDAVSYTHLTLPTT